MTATITAARRGCLPIDRKHAQRLRERAELLAIARGFEHPEQAAEQVVRHALRFMEVQR